MFNILTFLVFILFSDVEQDELLRHRPEEVLRTGWTWVKLRLLKLKLLAKSTVLF